MRNERRVSALVRTGLTFTQLEQGRTSWCEACQLPSVLVVRWLLSRHTVAPDGTPRSLLGCSVVATQCCVDCGANRYVDVPGPEQPA